MKKRSEEDLRNYCWERMEKKVERQTHKLRTMAFLIASVWTEIEISHLKDILLQT